MDVRDENPEAAGRDGPSHSTTAPEAAADVHATAEPGLWNPGITTKRPFAMAYHRDRKLVATHNCELAMRRMSYWIRCVQLPRATVHRRPRVNTSKLTGLE